MIDGLSQSREWYDLIGKHRATINEWRKDSEKLARATADYYKAKAQAELKYRKQGYPASMSQDLAKGDENVNPLLEQKTLMDAMVRIDQEILQLNKRQLDMIRDQTSREWSEAKNAN